VFSEISNSLQAMGLVQYLMVLLFLMSYPLALTEFAGARGRQYAALVALAAAVAFVAFTSPWEHGVLLVAVAVLAMGAFGAAVWLLYAAMAHLDLGTPVAARPRAASAQVSLVTALQESESPGAGEPQHKTSPPGVLPIA
jgi:hypothetical protein